MAYLAAALTLATVALPTNAWAYIDPSAGSIVIQLLLGGVAGAAVLAKLYYRRLISFFGRRPRSASPGEDEGVDRPQ